MLKIVGLICLVLVLASCNKEEKSSEYKDINIEKSDKLLIIDETKYGKTNRLDNQKIIKNYGNGLVLKQDTKGVMNEPLGFTILYLNGKELISLANNLTTIICDSNLGLNLCRNEKITNELIKERTANTFQILENSKEVEIDENSNIKILYTWEYESKNIYFIDIKNQTIINNENGMDFFVTKIKQGKSGTFILGIEGRGCGGGLFFIDNNAEKKDLFKNDCSVGMDNVPLSQKQVIIDFELMINKQVKVFYKIGGNDILEKIIKI